MLVRICLDLFSNIQIEFQSDLGERNYDCPQSDRITKIAFEANKFIFRCGTRCVWQFFSFDFEVMMLVVLKHCSVQRRNPIWAIRTELLREKIEKSQREKRDKGDKYFHLIKFQNESLLALSILIRQIILTKKIRNIFEKMWEIFGNTRRQLHRKQNIPLESMHGEMSLLTLIRGKKKTILFIRRTIIYDKDIQQRVQ